MPQPDIRTVGVVGCGLMGSGIAQAALEAGCRVVVREVDEPTLARGLEQVAAGLDRSVAKGRLTREAREAARAALRGTTGLAELAGCELVIEAIVEDAEAKRRLFAELDTLCPPATLFATNTSSLTVTELAAATRRADRVVGLHFFNPVPLMPLVEVARGLATGDEAFEAAVAFARRLGKTPLVVKDRRGFIVNALLVPYLMDAVRALESGVAGVADLDQAMRLGCGHPMGPLALLDFVGLDTALRIAEILYEEYREARYAPPPLLRRLVLAGWLGRKSGKGFYTYDTDPPRVTDLRL
ncbi:MAG TPA: 3-hydroxybutyryl-CoA dehydrogenase [Thermodesulfobacteriota bacterium]|nr:3-hydroxybutyryl-CoA dehydrogenase [Thermodesulfobacteriota bacterium]